MGKLLLIVLDEVLAVHLMPPKLLDETVVLIGRIESHGLTYAGNRLMALPFLGFVGSYDFLLLLVGLDELKPCPYLSDEGVFHGPFIGEAGDDMHKKRERTHKVRPHSSSVSR